MSEVGKDARRSLKIKTGSVTRLHKELRMYEAEVLTEAEKTERLRSACACPHDIRQQENVQGESAMMIPDCRLRLEHALGDLQAALEELGEGEGVAGSEEVAAARACTEDIAPLFT